jgi:hypothetical protein
MALEDKIDELLSLVRELTRRLALYEAMLPDPDTLAGKVLAGKIRRRLDGHALKD